MNRAAPVQMMPTGSPLPVGMTGASLAPKYQVRVRFRKRMRLQRVYTMVVELRPAEMRAPSTSASDSVIARPIIPGAHVQPLEQELGPKSSNNSLVFSVTPLAGGRLTGSRLQILHQGRVLDEIRTPMRATCPGRILLWASLTLLSLAYLVGILGPLPDLSTGPAAPTRDAAAPMTGDKPETTPAETKQRASVAAVLSQPPGKLPDYLKDEELPERLRDYLSRAKLNGYAQDAYDAIYQLPNLNFYITAVFLVLTLLSLLWNRPALWRSRRKGKVMMLPSLPQ